MEGCGCKKGRDAARPLVGERTPPPSTTLRTRLRAVSGPLNDRDLQVVIYVYIIAETGTGKKHSKSTQDASRHAHLLHTFIG